MKTLYSILIDFSPFLAAFWIEPTLFGLFIASLITGWLIYRQMRRKRLKTISIINGLFFIVSLLFAIFYPKIQLMTFSSLIIYTILSVTSIISLFIHQPFTYQYARESVNPALWDHPLFISINVKLTIVWSIMFSFSTIFSFLSMYSHLNGWLELVLTHVWNLIGILASIVWPPIAQRQYSARRKRNRYPEMLWEPFILAEPPQEKDKYDVIIIGSGIGGLTAAVELAAAGAKVLVLEQHYLFGGACTTYSRKGGFRFDAGVESISGLGPQGPVNHFLRRHALHEKINWLRNTYQFQLGDESFIIPHDVNAWRDLLQARFPHETKGIEDLFEELETAYHEMYDSFAPDRITPWVPESHEELLAYPSSHSHYFHWMDKNGRIYWMLLSTIHC
ncbi:MAG TPA: FAD-dependent oxidoreductase [Bacillota bacterium]|nr:FAD-dependent oxidoreductase [Bacillota bacterium]